MLLFGPQILCRKFYTTLQWIQYYKYNSNFNKSCFEQNFKWKVDIVHGI